MERQSRDERRERVADAEYELYRYGRNPDSLDRDRAYSDAYDHTGEAIARSHMRREDDRRAERAAEETEYERHMYEQQMAAQEQSDLEIRIADEDAADAS